MIADILLYGVGGFAALLAFLALLAAWTNRRIDAAVPPRGRFIDLPDARLHVVDQGTGPAILLVHGLGGQLRHFTYGITALLAPRFRVIAVDRPGSGHSTRVPGTSASLEHQADTLAALLTKLNVDRATVVGHSLGGAISLSLALRHPERVNALALIAPLTHDPQTGLPAPFRGLDIKSPALRKFVAWTFALPGFIVRSQTILRVVFGPEPVPRDLPKRGGGLLSLKPSQFIASSADLDAIEASLPAQQAAYARLKMPIHMLYGRGDEVLSPAVQGHAFVRAVPHCQLTLVDGGHMLPVTQVERTAAFIEKVAVDAEQSALQSGADGTQLPSHLHQKVSESVQPGAVLAASPEIIEG